MCSLGVLNGPQILHNTIERAKSWICAVGERRPSDIGVLQVHVLGVFCLHLDGASPDSLWRASGDLVRSAMTKGINQANPRPLSSGKVSPEYQRRLWITVIELEIQASLLCGLPPAFTSHPVDVMNSTIADQLGGISHVLIHTQRDRQRAAALLHDDEADPRELFNTLRNLHEATCLLAEDQSFGSAMLIVIMHRAILAFARGLLDTSYGAMARSLATASSLRVLLAFTSLAEAYWSAFVAVCGRDILQSGLVLCCMAGPLSVSPAGSESHPWLSTHDVLQHVYATVDRYLAYADNTTIASYIKDLVTLSVAASASAAPPDGQREAMKTTIQKLTAQLASRLSHQDSREAARVMSTYESDEFDMQTPPSSFLDFEETLPAIAFRFDPDQD